MPKKRQTTDAPRRSISRKAAGQARIHCVCGRVQIEVDLPPFWAWHDHSPATRHAHGAAYATYVGCWKSKVRLLSGLDAVTRFEDPESRALRSFCACCGTPLFFERPHAPKMVNIPRALFRLRTGREPRYHLGLDEAAEWEYRGETLAPLKGYPGVMWSPPRRKRRNDTESDF